MSRVLLLVSLLAVVVGVSACGDEGDRTEADDASPAVGESEPKEHREKVARTHRCRAEVSTTGAFVHDWSGEALVRTGGHPVGSSGPAAVYTLTDQLKNRVVLYSPGKDFMGGIAVYADGVAYAGDSASAATYDIDKRGKRALVDATVESSSGDELGVLAEFACGKQKK